MRKGRFSGPVAEIAQRYSESVSYDWRLYRQDIAGSLAHAAALAQAGIISADELDKIDNGLIAATDPDLSKYVARHGKLLLWHGWGVEGGVENNGYHQRNFVNVVLGSLGTMRRR